jgi:sulfide:quinone oxidoreductase
VIDHVDVENDRVSLEGGTTLDYDVLVVATGAQLLPEETDGLTGPGWQRDVFTFYTPEGAEALGRALQRFTGGRLAVGIVDMPVKCPVVHHCLTCTVCAADGNRSWPFAPGSDGR